MKLIVKQTVKKDKKDGKINVTLYSCGLEGYEFIVTGGGDAVVTGKLTLESESLAALKKIVDQTIDADVDIEFSRAQQTFDAYEEMVAVAREIVSGEHAGKTYKINVEKPESDES